MPTVRKCYHCKIIGLTKRKAAALEQEFNNLQHYLQTGEDLGLYSANKQQAKWFYKKIKKGKKYPISIRSDLLKLARNIATRLAQYWVRIPVKVVRGGIWLAIKPYEVIPSDAKIRESKLYKRDNNWYLDLIVQREIAEKTSYDNVIGIDLGIKHIATSVELACAKTIFYGKELNRIRGHFFWLRRSLGMKKALDTIRKIGDKERRITNDILHKISRDIVNMAMKTNSIIVIGNTKHLRKNLQKRYRRRMSRLLSGFPYYRLTQYIKYKAAFAGIRVVEVNEAWTSQICYRCDNKGRRVIQGFFVCDHCKREDNADRNAALNIAKRGLGYMSKLGVSVNIPRTPAMHFGDAMMTGEAVGIPMAVHS